MSQVKYKCKKSYPGGPVVGRILNPQDTWFAGMNYWWNSVWFDPKEYAEYWEKVVEKVKLFVTEDGVPIYDGDKYWYVQFDGYLGSLYQKLYTAYSFIAKASQVQFANSKTFSTKEKAESWIEENKPQYSKLDMIAFARYYKNTANWDIDFWIKNFKK